MPNSDEHYVQGLAEYLTAHFKGRDNEVRENRKARWGEDFTLADVPENYRLTTQLITLPRNQDTLQRMTALITDDEPAVTVPPPSPQETARRRANKCERGLSAMLDRTRQETGRDAWRNACDAGLADGMGVLHSWYKPDAWAEEPARDEGEDAEDYLGRIKGFRQSAPFPIALDDLDILNYYPLYSGGRLQEVLVISDRPIVPTLRALGAKALGDNTKSGFRKLRKGERFPTGGGLPTTASRTVKVTEHWTATSLTYYLDDKIVGGTEVDLSGYGRPPFFEVRGYTTSSRDPAKATRSAIESQRSLVKALNRFLTYASNWVHFAAFPFLVEKDGSNLTGDETTVMGLKPGQILRGVEFMPPPEVAKDLQALTQLLMGEIDRVGLTAVMYGANSGASSGYQVASLQAAAQSVLKPVIRNASTALSDLCSFWLRLIDQRIKDTVHIWGSGQKAGQSEWVELGPDDIRGYYVVHVELRPLLPLDEIAQRDSALRMVAGRLWSRRHALEKTGEEQPEDLLDEIAVEEYMEAPQIAERLTEDAATRAGLIKPTGQGGTQIFGPGGNVLANVPAAVPPGVGGPGFPPIQGMQPQVPGQNLPLRPPGPPGLQLPNQPLTQPGAGGPRMGQQMGDV